MCEGVAGLDIFSELLPCFCELVTDPIVNVRLELSLTVAKIYGKYADHPQICEVVRRLKTDSSRDVTYPLKDIILAQSDLVENLGQADQDPL